MTTSVPVDSLEDLEDLDEEVDDVQIELNGGGDVLLRRDPGHDHLQTDKRLKVDDVQVELNGGGDVLLRGDPGHDHLQTRQMVKG